MELRKNIPLQEFSELLELYIDAFPPEERRPVDKMPPADPAFNFYAVGDAGLLTAWEFPDFTYVEHFAVYPHMRGSGIGSEALAALNGTVVLEVEPPETGEMARRRIAFYERNGFRLLDVDYLQPPYSPGLPSVPLRLMVRGDLPDVETAIFILHSRVYQTGEGRHRHS